MVKNWPWVVAAALLLATAGCSDTTAGPSPSLPSSEARCMDPTVGPLPEWARAGFSPPDQPATYFLGAEARIVGVAFGWPLRATQPSGQQNKILWIAPSSTGGPLRITATRLGSDVTVTKVIDGGPGPSIVDMPQDGCWQFDLTWSGGNDRMYVRYGDPVASATTQPTPSTGLKVQTSPTSNVLEITADSCLNASGFSYVHRGDLTVGPFGADVLTVPRGAAADGGSGAKVWVASQRPGPDEAVLTVTAPDGSTEHQSRKSGEAFVGNAKQFYPGAIPLHTSGVHRLDVTVGPDHVCVMVDYRLT